MASYSFTTVWRIEAPIDAVWEEIYHLERWPSWWKHVKSITKLKEGDANDIGSMWHQVWVGKLPYSFAFDTITTRVERPHTLEGKAVGDLIGTGLWQLSEEGPVTVARYDWDIATTKWWMNLFAPIARQAFQWNHDVIMEEGGEALARRLGTTLKEAQVHSVTSPV